MLIEQNLEKVYRSIPKGVDLIAVSKTKPVSDIQEAYDYGQRKFGENRVQEMVNKYEVLPKDIEWHMIGHLQRNKVKYMAHFVHMIHGVDSFEKLAEINKQAKKHDRIIDCLLQVKIAQEETKFGLSFVEVSDILQSEEVKSLENVKIRGLMAMASFTSDEKQINDEFKDLKAFFDLLNSKYALELDCLSIGMSGDYEIAINNGSTMIRIGSSIFGNRNYIA